MLKNQLILKDPLSFLGYDTDETENKGSFGAVASRAGVGKTAFLVQIAISCLLKDKNVLHISIQDPVDKVNLWYSELFLNLTQAHDRKQSKQLWDFLLTRRFIMTFETESFDFSKLISRIEELKTQKIFIPQMIVLDGLAVENAMQSDLRILKKFAAENHFAIWFSIRTHRHQADDPVTLLKQLDTDGENALFDMVIQLLPYKDKIQVKRLAVDEKQNGTPSLLIDPATMMIKESPEKIDP
jgi:KaiC/GvpD/RAD55 family RecA-like ATPase